MSSSRNGTIATTAAVLRDPAGPFSLETVHLDPPGPQEVVVRVAGVGICHTDFMARAGIVRPPLVPGHEASGVVTAVGEQVADVAIGDHVVISYDSCGRCRNCVEARPAYCDRFWPRNMSGYRQGRPTTMHDAAGQPVQGRWFGQSSFAEVCVVASRNLVVVDKSLPLELLGPLTCGVLTGAGSVFNSLSVSPGASLVVFGVGTVGLSAVMAARAVGATTIVAVDTQPSRLALAEELGATHTFAADTHDLAGQLRAILPTGFDHSLDTTGVQEVITTAVDVLRVGGSCGLLGVRTEPVVFKPEHLALGRTIKGILIGDAVPKVLIPRLVELWKQGRFPFDRLIATYPLEQIDLAEKAMHAGEAVKPVLLPTAIEEIS
jgi:aryl-alcohol dehydrogenase